MDGFYRRTDVALSFPYLFYGGDEFVDRGTFQHIAMNAALQHPPYNAIFVVDGDSDYPDFGEICRDPLAEQDNLIPENTEGFGGRAAPELT